MAVDANHFETGLIWKVGAPSAADAATIRVEELVTHEEKTSKWPPPSTSVLQASFNATGSIVYISRLTRHLFSSDFLGF